ncbi:indolepyruvate ferredoxin oxidoreductase subunit alpha [Nitrospirota bacterium]
MSKTAKPDEKLLLSGNEAIALGAYEAGVKVASAYPGTPSTEILENFSKYEDIYCEWAPNEKVALEVGIGASFAGVRALVTMKHVGLNVAADPLFTAAYTGVKGGLVIINADDPSMHSSQNEQDNRNFAFAAKVPMLEPANSDEAKEFVKLAFEISEDFDTPVLVRTTTRVAHVKGLAHAGEMLSPRVEAAIVKDPRKFVMLPGHARLRRVELEARMERLREYAETSSINHMEMAGTRVGVIASGVSYLYVKEALPEASVLKLGMCWPLPEKMIKDFASKVDELYIVEELDPFLEIHIKAMGVEVKGKEMIPAIGELNSSIVRKSLAPDTVRDTASFEPMQIPVRPPNMCPGCPHRGIFHVLRKHKLFVAGDIGCYTLAALPPLSAMDSCVCMGAGIGVAHGMDKALGADAQGKVIAVIGDSTFMHSGITGIANIVYNKGVSTVVILDNRITAMTGHQNNPVTGFTIKGEPTSEVDLEALCRALGVKNVRVIDPHDIDTAMKVVDEEVNRNEPSVIITKAPCALLPEHRKLKRIKYATTITNCVGCKQCLSIGCPAISWKPVTPDEAKGYGFKEKQKGHSLIDSDQCDGCGQCAFLCKFDAIHKEGN